jgi:DNA-binding NarL/FixJ family response regulator
VEPDKSAQLSLHPHLIISIFDYPEYVRRSLWAGAFGYVLKDELVKILGSAMHTVHKGRQYFSPKIAGMINRYTDRTRNDHLVM